MLTDKDFENLNYRKGGYINDMREYIHNTKKSKGLNLIIKYNIRDGYSKIIAQHYQTHRDKPEQLFQGYIKEVSELEYLLKLLDIERIYEWFFNNE